MTEQNVLNIDFVLTVVIMYVAFTAAVSAEQSAVLTTGYVTYTQQINRNMRDKERRKVTVKN